MEFIEEGDEFEYIDVPGESRERIVEAEFTVEPFQSLGNFIQAMCSHMYLADFDEERIAEFQRKVENIYGEPRGEQAMIGPQPEMAEVIAMHLDEHMELSDEDVSLLQEHANGAFMECSECGESWRPATMKPPSQEELCNNCYRDMLMEMDVEADVSEMLNFIDTFVPDNGPPSPDEDENFYALAMEVFTQADGDRAAALHHQLGEACDELHEAAAEERPADKDFIRGILEDIHVDQ